MSFTVMSRGTNRSSVLMKQNWNGEVRQTQLYNKMDNFNILFVLLAKIINSGGGDYKNIFILGLLFSLYSS